MRAITWKDVLATSGAGQHIAQTYREESFLVESVSLFAEAGLKDGQGVLMVATKPHLRAFAQQLRQQGYDIETARSQGQWQELAVEDVLSAIMRNGAPDAVVFKRLAESAMTKTRGHGTKAGIRIFGELVNVLWLAGNMAGAMAIEALWDELGKTHPFTLFCSYLMDTFEQTTCTGPLQSVCKTHSYLIPAENYERLDDAVLKGSRDILGESLAEMVRGFAIGAPATISAEMPVAQKTLLWLHENMPVTAEKVSLRTQRYYDFPTESN